MPDLETAVEQYWTLFGIGPWHFYTYGKPLIKEMSYQGRPAEYKMRIALSYLGPLRIELIEPLAGDTVYADFVAERGVRFDAAYTPVAICAPARECLMSVKCSSTTRCYDNVVPHLGSGNVLTQCL